jgi:preprotein translocase subunit SecB
MKDYQFYLQQFTCEDIRFSKLPVHPSEQTMQITPNIKVNHQREGQSLSVNLIVEIAQKGLPFALSVNMLGLFLLENADIAEEKLARIARVNCASILFPFVREVVADLTRRGGFPSLLLPPINFVTAASKVPAVDSQS